MQPYFETSHPAAALILIATMAWGMMELAKQRGGRPGATRVGGAGARMYAAFPVMAAATAMLLLAPRIVPAATIRPGVAAFAAGTVILLGGLVLRGWSIGVLGDYFTGTVMVSSDQPVIAAGPYRVLRHPSYTGFLLACAGLSLAAANWVSLAAMVLLPLPLFIWRIHAEESALLATLGDRYGGYAARHKRLIPLVW
jgi:protein-S-isoprenylcysteine O-methyltransferase Ste14